MIYGYFYRLLMRIAHRFEWHYAPIHGPLEDGKFQRWCQWCGFRESYRHHPKTAYQDITRELSTYNFEPSLDLDREQLLRQAAAQRGKGTLEQIVKAGTDFVMDERLSDSGLNKEN